MQIDDDAISDAKKYFFKSDGHQTRIYYPLTHCQYGIYVQSYIMYLFVCIADFHRFSATALRIFIDYPQQGYNYSLKHTGFLISYLALIE